MGAIQDLDKALKAHDWYYEMSDDHGVWKKGSAELKNIHNLIKQVDKKVAEKLWAKYAPKNKAANGPMFPFPKNLVREMEGDKMAGGKGDKTNPKDVDQNELKVGMKVEREHTDSDKAAEEIALDHLTENPKYYSELIKSGIVDEKEALDLAKQLGMAEAIQIGRLRNIIKEEVRKILEAKYMNEKEALEMMKKGKTVQLSMPGGVSNSFKWKGGKINTHDGTRWMGWLPEKNFLDYYGGETQFKL